MRSRGDQDADLEPGIPGATDQDRSGAVGATPHSAEVAAIFADFGAVVYRKGALSMREKQLIAVAVAHALGCPECIRGHSRLAARQGARDEELVEAIWVASQVMAGRAAAHAALAARSAGEARHGAREAAADAPDREPAGESER